MTLYIGGFGQGKLEYVSKTENINEFFDGEKEDIDKLGNYRAINKFNLLIKRLLEQGIDVYEFIKNIDADIIICDEVGNGVIPMSASEERYRETVGRCCIIIAEKSDRVVRIFCGIGQVIK